MQATEAFDVHLLLERLALLVYVSIFEFDAHSLRIEVRNAFFSGVVSFAALYFKALAAPLVLVKAWRKGIRNTSGWIM